MSPPIRKRSKPKSDDSFQSVAKRLECDEDKAAFEAKLGKIAKAKPSPPTKTNKLAWGKGGFKSKP